MTCTYFVFNLSIFFVIVIVARGRRLREGGSAPDPGCAPNPTGSDDPPRPVQKGGNPHLPRCSSIDSVLVERPYTYRTFYSAG